MKITKTNYNELRKQELDNNFAKVWHVNELADEVAGMTPYKSYVAEFIFDYQKPELTVTEIYNNLGATITWDNPDGGYANFRIAASDPVFTDGKLMYNCVAPTDDNIVYLYPYHFTYDSETLLYLFISNTEGTYNNNVNVGSRTSPAKIEIKVYN